MKRPTEFTVKKFYSRKITVVIYVIVGMCKLLGLKHKVNKSKSSKSIYVYVWGGGELAYKFRVSDH